MRTCPPLLSHLDHAPQGFLLLAVLVFFLFLLPSFMKEPNTKPSRDQHMLEKERSPESLHKAAWLVTTEGGRTGASGAASAGPAPPRGQERKDPAPPAPPKGQERKDPAPPAPPKGQERKDSTPLAPLRDQERKDPAPLTPPRGQQRKDPAPPAPPKGQERKDPAPPTPLRDQERKDPAPPTPPRGQQRKDPAPPAPPRDQERKDPAPPTPPRGQQRKDPAPPTPPRGQQRKDPAPLAPPKGQERKDPAPPTPPRGQQRKDPAPPAPPKGQERKDPAPPTPPRGQQRKDPAPPTPPRGQQRKDPVLDTLPPRAQNGGMASEGPETPSLSSRDRRTMNGRQDQNKEPRATRTEPAKPRGKAQTTAPTPLPKSQAKALTTPGAGSTGRTMEGVTSHWETVRATPPSTRFWNHTTQGSPSLRAANFKSEPRWDFEEQYSFDTEALQSSCPDSVKVKASKSPWLQKLFLANLTLFLDSSRFNQREWERLEHFAPPYGFMELNRSLVQKVVTRFPPVPQQQLLLAGLPPGSSQCITCAVVGNGGILNNSHVGQEIDSHDHVFRLSGAITKGYEQDVGTRTSFYGFTAFSITQSLLALGRRGFPHAPLGKDVHYLHFLEGTRDYEWLEALLLNQTLVKSSLFWFRRRPQEAFRESLHLDRYLLVHPDLIRYMKNRFLRSKNLDSGHWRIYRPTTGALLLLTALQLCDQVSAYGFITEGHERFSDHYYDKSWKKTIFYINHDFPLERALWKRLHDEGVIRLYQRPMISKPKL